MKLYNTLFVFVAFNFLYSFIIAQTPNIQWQKTYGGTRDDVAYSTCNTNDGGFMIIGVADSEDGNVIDHKGPGSDVWLLKLDSLGNLKSNKSYGGTYEDEGRSIKQTFDGGFIFASSTSSIDGDVTGKHNLFGGFDFWVVKIDYVGIIQWQKCLGSMERDEAADIIQTADSGYLVTGYVSWLDDDVTGYHGGDDMWVAKLSKNGVKQWTKSLGGSDFDWGRSCVQTKDGGYLIAGTTASVDGDVSGLHGAPLGVDAWVVKLNSLGQIEWQKCYGGTSLENGYEVVLSNDGGFFLFSSTSSTDGDVSDNHGSIDFWLVKADSVGTIQWQKCFGGTYNEAARAASSTSDGGIAMIGTSNFDDGMVTGTHGRIDFWLCKVDSSGNFQWGKSLGGTEDDRANSIQETPDGGLLLAGSTVSTDGDVTSNRGSKDYWIVKLAPLGLSIPVVENSFMGLEIFQNNDLLNVRFFSKKNKGAQLFLYDVTGKKVFEKSILVNEGINYNSVNCSGFTSGMYFVRVDGGKGLLGGRFVIE